LKKIIIIDSHPIQYYTPLYKEIVNSGKFDLEVWFCSKIGVENYFDKEFNTNVKWDIPLLEGFNYVFLKNWSIFKNYEWPLLRLINLGLIWRLFKLEKSVIWVHSWGQISFILAIIFAKLFGHTVCLRAETPLIHEKLKNNYYLLIRKFILKIFFSAVDKFLFIGTENKLFYQFYGIKNDQLIFSPYCVNNEFFRRQFIKYIDEVDKIKLEFNIPLDKKLILTSGKLIQKKRPLDILKAFELLDSNHFLIFLGGGSLETDLQNYIAQKQLSNVLITGFVNQSAISKYYAITDVYVMASHAGETWGLSTNEIMNFNAALVISDLVGCNSDLVIEDKNGYVYPCGNIVDLKNSIERAFKLDKIKLQKINKLKMEEFSYETIVNNLYF
jgi:glycosyltransferase involved in cell wall biosynthesis